MWRGKTYLPFTLPSVNKAVEEAWMRAFVETVQRVLTMPAFFDVADTFATPKQRFLTLDVGRFPEIAEKTLGVPLDASGPASAVPSALLFLKGEEIARVPRAYLEGAKVKGRRMRGIDIIKGLGIDEGFERTSPKSVGKRPDLKKKD